MDELSLFLDDLKMFNKEIRHDEWMCFVEVELWRMPKGKMARKIHSRIWEFANDVVCMDENSDLYQKMNSILREMIDTHPQEQWLRENVDAGYYDRVKGWGKA